MVLRPFGAALVDALDARRWKQADLRRALAERDVDVTHAAVGEWVRGTSLPSADKAAVVIELVADGDKVQQAKLWSSLAAPPTTSDEAA